MLHRTVKIRLIFTLLAVLAVVAVAASRMPATVTANSGSALTSVIVELREEPAAIYRAKAARDGNAVSDDALQAYRDQLRAGQDQFLAALQTQGVAYTVRGTDVRGLDGNIAGRVDFRYTLVMNGVALTVPRSAVPMIAGMPQVKQVHADEVFHPLLDRAVSYVQAPRAYSNPAQTSQYPSLNGGGGYHGEGVNVAVLDTGTDWSHPMFGDDPTPPRLGLAQQPPSAVGSNQKVIYTLPLVAVPADGVQDDFGHGTHVAADIAGYLAYAPGADSVPNTADDITLHGIAPQARLMTYKVCYGIGSALANLGVPAPFIGGCNGSAIIMGMEDSLSPRTITGYPKPIANIINMSLGGSGGPDSATAVAADNAVVAGAIVVASAGNSGPGEGTVGAPSAGRRVISVAANTDPGVADIENNIEVLEANRTSVKPGTPRIRATFSPESNAATPISQPITQNYVFAGLADTPDQVPVTALGRICLAERGSTATVEDQGTGLFANKAANCAAKGGVALVVYNNAPGPVGVVLGPSTIPVFTISREDGLVLRNDLGFDATGVSNFPIRINPAQQGDFTPEMAGFSSRGPVRGFGQVKPDVTAPGVAILAATTPVGIPLASMADPTRYISASGTSFSGPIVAGVAALIKQAHPTWNADMVRTALINTATNLRDANGNPRPEGAQSINDQGGGLVHAYNAVHARALMGVAGDGIASPSILGSHSYGEVPVINSRVTHTESVTVTIQDVSGQGGTYNLRVANNRALERNGLSASLSRTSVSVPSNGTATFTVNATVDGNIIRDTSENLQMQWYVVAEQSGGQTLRMPFYLKPTPTQPTPAAVGTETKTFTGMMPASDTGLGVARGVTYIDHPVDLDASVLRVEADLTFEEILDDNVADLDLYLLDPDGNQVTLSGNPGGPEHLSATITRPGRYTYRVVGWANGPTDYTLVSTHTLGGIPPTLAGIPGDFTDAQGRPVDFDGQIALQWQPNGGEQGFEIERSTDGTNYSVVATTDGNTYSATLADQPNGALTYRVRSLTEGRIGYYVSAGSNTQTIVVDRRGMVEITEQVRRAVANPLLEGGIFKMDLTMMNQSTSTYVPHVELYVVRINSASGTVRVINADNGGDGTATPALFSYSNLLGSDQEFAPGETTGARHLQFRDDAAEMFMFDVVVTAYQRGASPAGATGGGAGAAGASGGDGSASGAQSPLRSFTRVLRFTVNPLTRSVTSRLL